MQLLQFDLPKISAKPAPHQKAYWCELIGGLIHKPLRQVLGMTKDWPLGLIKDSYDFSKSAKNPDKAWWYFRKNTNL